MRLRGVCIAALVLAILPAPADAQRPRRAPDATDPRAHADTSDQGAESAREVPPADPYGAKPGQRWAQPVLGASRSGGPEVLFTFDDGPRGGTTDVILDALKKHNIKSIFFMAGWRVSDGYAGWQRRRAIVRRLIAEGHWLGNHTVNHIDLCKVPAEDAAWEIDENTRRLSRLVGHAVTLFRAPYGVRCRRMDAMLAERGLRHLHWDIDAHEFLTLASADATAEVTAKLARLKGRAILLLHDTKFVTARALPKILAWLDEENARRRAVGEPEIRILSPLEVVLDDVPTPFLALGGLAVEAAHKVPDALAWRPIEAGSRGPIVTPLPLSTPTPTAQARAARVP